MAKNRKSVLVIGGGIGGMAAVLVLRRAGYAVDLIERDQDWRVYGAGLTITGPTLRAFRTLGFLDAIRREGTVMAGTRLLHFTGTYIADLDEPALDEGLPSTGGILRPVLHRLMSDAVRDSGAEIRLGVTTVRLTHTDGGVDVAFSDGTTGHYALAVGADGIYSQVRSMLFPNPVAPRYTGQVSWRVLADRPTDFDRNEIYLGSSTMAAIIACSPTKVYGFVLKTDPQRTRLADDAHVPIIRDLLADFGGNMGSLRDGLGEDSSVVYRPFETAMQPRPWRSGFVTLLGDAAHATTPHLASGAGIAVEDAIVLGEELTRHGDDIEAGLAAYEERRFERCRFVVERSLAICEAQMRGETQDVGRMTGEAMHHLAQDI